MKVWCQQLCLTHTENPLILTVWTIIEGRIKLSDDIGTV